MSESRFETVLAFHLASLARGHSPWIDTGRTLNRDGTTTIDTLRNPVTGEVVSRHP